MTIFIIGLLGLLGILLVLHFTMGRYYSPYFIRKYPISILWYNGMRRDVKCWFNKGTNVLNFKEYDDTYELYPQGKTNGYFSKSWLPMTKETLDYFNAKEKENTNGKNDKKD